MSHQFLVIPSYVHIYQGVKTTHFDAVEIADRLKAILAKAEIDIRPEFISFCLSDYGDAERDNKLNELAIKMATLKVRDAANKDAHLTGYHFCDDKNCRLFNAHRQSEMIHAQLLSQYELCSHHQTMLDQLKEV